MRKLNNGSLKLGVQKNGRLTEETIKFLKSAGLEFENYNQRLFSTCRNFPLETVYVRDDDIPDYVESGAVDLGIVGQNLINETRPNVKKLLNLRYGFCSLSLAVLKESTIKSVKELENKTIATSYPSSTEYFFKIRNIKANIIKIKGS
ncbi:ATP phosphoribosyltransferase, partial [Candidatus Roizmanbacteria bacterium]|nr:ATP phosphoribosyltransferase [Candidatus Roizmanbacteria bacterium]